MSRYDGTWRTYTTADGLADNSVSSILEDKEGNLWFGTLGGGVSRYDGERWMTFTTGDGLVDNWVMAVLEDRKGNLWFGNSGDVSRYDGEKWMEYYTTEDGPGIFVSAILEDREGNLWFGSLGGVSRYDGERWKTFTTEDGLANDFVNAILEDSKGNLWFGTGGGLSSYDGERWTNYTIAGDQAGNSVEAILEDRNGNLWFGTVGGAIRLDGERLTTFTTEDGLAHNTVSSILEDSEGNLWFATNGGVSRYDGTWTIYTTEDGLADNVVLTILEDREGNLWFGTSEGVNRYDGERWTTFTTEDGLAHNWVAVIFEDREGNLWFGTVFGGVSRYDGERWTNYTTEDGLANNSVEAIFEDSEGDLWFGTIRVIISEVDVTVEGGGVSRYDGEMWTTYTTEDGLANDWVDLIFEDTEGNMWFGTENEGGVSRYDGERWKTYTTEDGLAGNQVYTIFEDSDGNLWLGTVFRGVSRYDETWTTYTTEDGLANNSVEAILEDTEGNLWFGTFEGVSRYDGERWTTYTTADGLAHNWVLTIFEDSEGNLWFGTYAGGVSRYDGEKWTTYTTEDGLAHNWVEAILEDREGNMWFLNGGFVGRGITRYRGDRIPPNTFIFDGPEGTIGIPQAFFQYSGGDRYSPEADVQYAYVIDPSEADWSDFTDLTSLLTDPFPNGTYTFYVRAIDKAGNIDLTPAKRTFTVDLTPPTVLISSPSNNEIIQGEVSIEGSAFDNSDIPDFGSYTLEYGSGSDEDKISEWRSVRDRTTKPVVNDLLGVWDTEGLFGTYVLRLRAVDGFDHRSKYAITVQVDNIPPTAHITSPSPNTTYSGTLSIHGTVEDENLRGYTLQYARTSQDTVWKDIKSDTTSGIEEGLLASWDSSNETGKITLRLEATDFAGNVSTPSDVILNLDNSGALPQSQITFPSPGEVVSGLVTIRGKATDDNFQRYTLLSISADGDTTMIKTSDIQVEEILGLWGTDLYPEGAYTLLLTTANRDGYARSSEVQVTVDNTSPVASITFPSGETSVSGSIQITGTVLDNHLKFYKIEFGPGADPDSSQMAQLGAERKEQVEEGPLGTWNTLEFNGLYSLILTAVDKAGLETVDKRVIQLENIPIDRALGGFKEVRNVRLYLPPNATSKDVVIGVRFLRESELSPFDDSYLRLIGEAFEIESAPEAALSKPAALSVFYLNDEVMDVSEDRLTLFGWTESGNWRRIGGTVEKEKNQITTVLARFGRFAVMEDLSAEEGSLSISDVNCQPRVFSPEGDGFDTKTTISFNLGKRSEVTVKVYDVSGRFKRKLVEDRMMNRGSNAVIWDGRDHEGKIVVNGLYVVAVEAGREVETNTVVVLNK